MKSTKNEDWARRAKMGGFGTAALGLLMLSTILIASVAQAEEMPDYPPGSSVSKDVPPPPALPADKPNRERKYYGNQIVLADGIADSMVLTAGAFGFVCALSNLDLTGNGGGSGGGGSCTVAEVTLGLSAATYALVPPIIHGAHGRPGAAFGSFGLRVGLPGSALLTSFAVDEELGFLVFSGRVTAALIDWFALAYEKPEMVERQSSDLKLRATLLLSEGDAGVGLHGQF